ncbi:Uncharacterized protein PECH_007070 [Penicillium ucsense]|uniref:Zf-CHY-domain-containing protein n=1 Tax=Penicillium ucsense TaxID=2839758 RepID=A0A8J8WHP3_9EURO|nr:Uncharacterized protein PECM_007917 [Penicillium ucsense]KAF7735185.1 Uncharacterized protein PECH_007070 [Penicillium ucsense]
MSNFLASILIELGFRARVPYTAETREQGQASPNGEEITSPTSVSGDSETHNLPKNHSSIKPPNGNADLLPDCVFFANLHKDMDSRTPELESSRTRTRSIQGLVFDNEPSAATSVVPIHHGDDEEANALVANEGNSQISQTDTLAPHTEATRIDGTEQSQETAQTVGGLSQAMLPADDGMGWLRKQIHAIRDLDLSSNEKARMVHELMTANYKSCHVGHALSPTTINASLDLQEPGHFPDYCTANEQDLSCHLSSSPLTAASVPRSEISFILSASDLQPTYAPKVEPESQANDGNDVDDDDADTEECDEAVLGCQHYHRNVKLQCFACKKWYTCRFCHDAVETHPLVRRDTENMLCMSCGHAQPAAQVCKQCEQVTAQYYCDICKLWDNDSKKSIYHCHDCGICRIGLGLGKDFFHCQTCSVCLPISIEDTHRCIERSTQCDCPICGDYMFTSPETVVVMRCGHSIHHRCLAEYSKTSFRCPICSKTITNMESTFRNLDRTIESQPMPAEFTDTKALVYCNDCGAKSVVKYHWLGLKCDLCESYNTAQIRVLQGDDVPDITENVDVESLTPRPRPASLTLQTETVSSLAGLNLDAVPDPLQLSSSLSTVSAQNPRFVSYNITHGRAISPVVRNYFGLPTDREPEKPSSLPFFGNAFRAEGETDYGALNFLSKKLRDRYGFLAGESSNAEHSAAIAEEDEEEEDEDGDDGSTSSSESSISDREGNEEDEDDGDEYMDIFGHR